MLLEIGHDGGVYALVGFGLSHRSRERLLCRVGVSLGGGRFRFRLLEVRRVVVAAGRNQESERGKDGKEPEAESELS